MQKGDTYNQPYFVTPTIYNGFINLFNDCNPLHTNAEFAQKNGFKAQVMHGNILGGFLSHFIGECLPLKNVIIHWQEIKYLKPVYLNDKLNLCAEIVEVHESVNAIEFKYFFENQEQVKIAKGKIQIGIML